MEKEYTLEISSSQHIEHSGSSYLHFSRVTSHLQEKRATLITAHLLEIKHKNIRVALLCLVQNSDVNCQVPLGVHKKDINRTG